MISLNASKSGDARVLAMTTLEVVYLAGMLPGAVVGYVAGILERQSRPELAGLACAFLWPLSAALVLVVIVARLLSGR